MEQATRFGTYSNQEVRESNPPTPSELLDYVLVLDDLSKTLPPPGTAPAASAR